MAKADLKFADPAMREIGPASQRGPQMATKLKFPAGALVVSADDHCEVTPNIFKDNFPARLKDRAPEVWFDKFWRIGYKGELENWALGEKIERATELATAAGVADQLLHVEHMDAEGIGWSVMYPQSLLGFVRLKDLEVLEQMYRTYNEYVAELQNKSGGRTLGVGIFSNWWDPAAAERSMRQIVDLGLKTVMAPITPGKNIDGKTIHYGDQMADRFWSVIEDAGLPFSFHVGEGIFDTEYRGGVGSAIMVSISPFRKPLGQVIFGGVFDRHPKLKVVFAEGGLAWLLGALQDAEMLFDTMGNGVIVDRIEQRPTTYWQNNCYATFQNDLIGLRNIDYIGADRVMWASDYPHSEGTFGFTTDSLMSIVNAVSEHDARLIMGGTAAKLYGIVG
jgi:predicted TIM-barrel fold metal-dependent hydrolase